jgi:hypothetical protein
MRNEQSHTYTIHQFFMLKPKLRENHIMLYFICLEELHSLEAPTSFVFQLQLEGGFNPLVSHATT